MKTKVLDFEVLSHIHANGTLQKYGRLEFQRQGCEYRMISPISCQGTSAEKEAYQELVSKLNKSKAKRIETEQVTTSEEAFRTIFLFASHQEASHSR